MKKLSLFVCLALVVGLLLGSFQPALAANVLLVAPGGSDTTNCQVTPCATINYAIGQALPGDEIHLAAGVYAANVTLDKHVAIIGAGSGVGGSVLRKSAAGAVVTLTASGASAADPLLLQDLRIEPVGVHGITVPNGSSVAYVKLDNVQVIGTNPNNSTESEIGLSVYHTASLSYLEISHSAFDHLIYGWYLFKSTALDGATVQNVTVSDTSFSYNDAKGLYAEKLSDATFTRTVAHDNGLGMTIFNNAHHAGFDINLKYGAYQNLTFNDVTFTSNANGLQNGAGLLVKARDDGGYAAIPASLTNVAINGCVVSGNERGIRFGEMGKTNATPTNVSVHGCKIYGNVPTFVGAVNTGGMINFTQSSVNAENNWWGCAAGPGNPGCDAVDMPVSTVDYTPWLLSSGDVFVDAVNGSDVFGTGSAGAPFATIQKGVDMAANGMAVHIAAGTYSGTVNIDGRNNLSLLGVDRASVIIKPASVLDWNAAGYTNNRKAAVRVVNSTDITLQGLTLDMDLVKANFVTGVFGADSSLTFNDNILKNNAVSDAAGGYYELGIAVRAPGYSDAARAAVTISNSEFIDAGRVALNTHGFLSLTITGNTFAKLVDDFGYGIELGSESEGVISNNVFYGFDTPALSDNSSSGAIYIENAFTNAVVTQVVKDVTISDNEIYGCQYGITIGNQFNNYAGNVDMVITATDNYIHDNTASGILITDEDQANGSSVTYTGSGNRVEDNLEAGYFLYTIGDGSLTVDLSGETITGNDYGVYLNDYDSTPPSASTYDVTVAFSDLSGNTTAGLQNDYAGIMLDGQYNWFGCVAGPGSAGCSAVVGQADGMPWLGTVPAPAGSNIFQVPAGLDDAADVNDLIANAATSGDTIVLMPGTHSPTGGYLITKAGMHINAVGATLLPNSPCFTVSADNTFLYGGICTPSAGSPGIVTGAVVSGLSLRNMEITAGTGDGIQINHNVTNFQVVDNFIHALGGDGLHIASGVTLNGVIDIMGNLFQANTGAGVNHEGVGTLTVEYNAWGDLAGPTGPSGDGALGTLDFTPWTHAAISMQSSASPVANKVALGQTIDYTINIDAAELYGADFDLAFDNTRVEVVSITNLGAFTPIGGGCAISTPLQANTSGVIGFCGQRFTALTGAAQPVYRVTLRGLAAGVSALNVDESDDMFAMAPPSGGSTLVYAAALTDGAVEVFPAFTVTARFDLQGRANDSGVTLNLDVGENQGYGPHTANPSDYWGLVSLANVVEDTYLVTASMPRYLALTSDLAKKVDISAAKLSLNLLVLLGGDIAGVDNNINSADSGLMGSQYGSAGPNADVNNDGTVNVLDLVLLSVNFGQTSASAYAGWTP